MKIHRDLSNLPNFKNAVITIGTFDGVHCGHQKILKKLNEAAKSKNGESILITFHPHPRSVVLGKNVELLSPLEEKFDILRKMEIDNVVVVPFTRNFSSQSPYDYVRNFLFKNFSPKKIIIGYDHKFGKNRAGDIHFLKAIAEELQLEVEEISKQEIDEIAVSSTKVRAALRGGEVEKAQNLLGYTYFLRGIVVKGQQLGRKIGFPTANLQIYDSDKLIPGNGVYVVKIKIDAQTHGGMMNIGNRPTLADNLERTIEVNIFDFENDIYGEKVEVLLIKKIRNEQKFTSLDEMVKRIKLDKEEAVKSL